MTSSRRCSRTLRCLETRSYPGKAARFSGRLGAQSTVQVLNRVDELSITRPIQCVNRLADRSSIQLVTRTYRPIRRSNLQIEQPKQSANLVHRVVPPLPLTITITTNTTPILTPTPNNINTTNTDTNITTTTTATTLTLGAANVLCHTSMHTLSWKGYDRGRNEASGPVTRASFLGCDPKWDQHSGNVSTTTPRRIRQRPTFYT